MADLMQQAREPSSPDEIAFRLRNLAQNMAAGSGPVARDHQAWKRVEELAEAVAALSAAPEGLIEQHARDSQELRRLCQSRDFYKLRCEALQAVQSNMRDPERKAVCDILANGSTSALAARPQGVKDA